MTLGLFAVFVAQPAARFGSLLSTHSVAASGRPLIPPCALTYVIAAWMPAHPSPLDPWVENSERNARLIGFPWAVEVPADPLLFAAAGLADPVDEVDEHAVTASAAAASPQMPLRRAPRFMRSPVVRQVSNHIG